jgi:nucleoside-diphosphate-sugar epimerase
MQSNLLEQIWTLSFKDKKTDNTEQFVGLTEQLIQLYDDQGRLDKDPLEPSRKRQLSLPAKALSKLIKGRECLVTGGLGCVGSKLVQHLLDHSPEKIIVVDKLSVEESPYKLPDSNRIIVVQADILDDEKLGKLFAEHLPEYVFHTAAQRDPGIAEKNISATVKTNILGTLNVLNACEKTSSVKQCVFSSTGKASRYYTTEIYAATKKVCEMLLDNFAREGTKKYSMVRFTHIVDNSLMDQQLKEFAQTADKIAIHSPGKFVTAQNVDEAACLMLNALIYAEEGKSVFLLVKNLEWPVESLELALYYIKTFKRKIPIVFSGNPKGYGEKFFRGQLDWRNPLELNLLINVYENRHRKLNPENDIIISSIVPFSTSLLTNLINNLKNTTGEDATKAILVNGLKTIFKDSLKNVDPSQTIEILKWGLDPKLLAQEGLTAADFGDMVPIMTASLAGTSNENSLQLR